MVEPMVVEMGELKADSKVEKMVFLMDQTWVILMVVY
jgi:hypothetical protein